VDGEPASDVTIVDHVKLFRNRPDLRFEGRIHEQILPAIRAAGGDVAWTDMYVVHSGSDQSPAAQEVKRKRDLRLLELELADWPEHPFTLFNLGMTYCHASRFEDAAGYLKRGIARAGAGDSHLRKAYSLLVHAETQLRRYDDAAETCRLGRTLFPRDAELRFREAVLLHELGRLEESRRAYLDVLSFTEERHLGSVIGGLTGFKARQNLAVVSNEMGDLAEAERQWREVVREAPRYRPGWRGLAETLSRAGLHAAADSVADQLVRDDDLRVEGLLIKGRTASKQERWDDVRAALDQAVAERPDDLVTLRERCEFLFNHGTPDEAERALLASIDRDPRDASAFHNLGTVMMRSGRHEDAVRAFERSVLLRPNFAATHLSLGYALKDCGRIEEAASAWEQASRLAPNDPTARQELERLGRV
jgi:tetratricopeptide (TPR) repeat protein